MSKPYRDDGRKKALADLALFAAMEVASGDLEPWAAMLSAIKKARNLGVEETLWMIKLYNAYDALDSTWNMATRWPTPFAWFMDPKWQEAANYPCTQERRGLRGGRVLNHLKSYFERAGLNQLAWLEKCPKDYWALTKHVRSIWGVGRQTAFEWLEFLNKVADQGIYAPDAALWESLGPRRSLEALWNDNTPTEKQLNKYASDTREYIAEHGTCLAWEDFETVICDFHVMRTGGYYPGRHLAAVRGEIEGVTKPAQRMALLDLFTEIIPEPWNRIAPGIDKSLLPFYRDTGEIQHLEDIL